MSGFRRSSRAHSIFVGNIPYGATEEELTQIFSEVGQVVSFRIVYDRETGKPRGYGFCEYRDEQTARSAMRNLNGYDMNGRQLRVDYADRNKSNRDSGEGVGAPSTGGSSGGSGGQGGYNAAPVEEAKTTMEDLALILTDVSDEDRDNLLGQFKTLVTESPDEARRILLENAPLAHAILQLMVLSGSVADPEQLIAAVTTSTAATAAVAAPAPTATAPVAAAPAAAPNLLAVLQASDPQAQVAIIQQILELTPDQIAQLAPEDQAQILQLRAEMGALTGGQL